MGFGGRGWHLGPQFPISGVEVGLMCSLVSLPVVSTGSATRGEGGSVDLWTPIAQLSRKMGAPGTSRKLSQHRCHEAFPREESK